jgi:hypothetical protein
MFHKGYLFLIHISNTVNYGITLAKHSWNMWSWFEGPSWGWGIIVVKFTAIYKYTLNAMTTKVVIKHRTVVTWIYMVFKYALFLQYRKYRHLCEYGSTTFTLPSSKSRKNVFGSYLGNTSNPVSLHLSLWPLKLWFP